MEPTDLELIRRAKHGDAAAFHGLVDRYARPLHRFAVMLVGNSNDADDVLQETFIGAFKALTKFEERSSVKTWLSRILVNQAARLRRDRLVRNSAIASVDVESIRDRKSESADDVRLDLLNRLQKLSNEHRAVIVLREMEGLSYDEIAQVLNIPRGTVESRLHRARSDLREQMKSYRDD